MIFSAAMVLTGALMYSLEAESLVEWAGRLCGAEADVFAVSLLSCGCPLRGRFELGEGRAGSTDCGSCGGALWLAAPAMMFVVTAAGTWRSWASCSLRLLEPVDLAGD